MKLIPRFALPGLLLLALAGVSPSAQAQVNITVVPPAWGPAVPAGAQYYYIPEVGGYYDLRAQRYVLLQNGQWARVANVSGYNPSSFHPVVIDYVGAQPWTLIRRHRSMYPASLPPGQVKRLESGKGLPPGQAKKLNRGYGYEDRGDDKGKGKGKGHGKH